VKSYTIAEADGRILQTMLMVGLPDMSLFTPGSFYVEGKVNKLTHYLPGGAATERPTITATLDKNSIVSGGEIAILSGLPIPCTVTVASQQYAVNDGSFEFTLPLPGEYTITVEGFPYLSKTYEVTAT
jgi:hypothetical protein